MQRTYLPLLALSAAVAAPAAWAAVFDAEPVPQNGVLVAGQALGKDQWKLVVLDQINSNAPCWSAAPSGVIDVVAPPTSDVHCKEFTSSSGYSARVAGDDLSRGWRLRVEPSGQQLVLELINPATDLSLVIGRSPRRPSGMTAFKLEPGWSPERRSYQGKPLQHIYLSNAEPLAVLMAKARNNGNLIARPPALLPAVPGSSKTAQAPVSRGNGSLRSSSGPIALQVIPYKP
ncbi:DUF3747 domain-containing protein [Synechococcus sp. HK05]|uniref:DUF3747 domain-containing protein n=1 Tax=Synechococcus sp. HK05 TaxID=2725975 RepID=UPI001C38D3E2|nr:DUF3747 domain-containing protein [Synechococcus sp. HK05]MBV2352434.1 DUF3747 domain-containing protein [Synechococcus sp. HK05]